jgi:HAD superfamily hydrolase (TIGR01549 family)
MKKFIIFDLDGVIFDSKNNMRVAWNQVNKELELNIKFKDYFANIGRPFEEIMKKLGVRNNVQKAKKIFRKKSIKNFNLIKLYPSVKSTLRILENNKQFKLGVITSKEKTRTIMLLKKFKLKFKYVQCPVLKQKGKPDPFLLNKLIKKAKEKKNNTYYVGDTPVDYKFAKQSNINFIFCSYGYGKIPIKSIKRIKKFQEIIKYF